MISILCYDNLIFHQFFPPNLSHIHHHRLLLRPHPLLLRLPHLHLPSPPTVHSYPSPSVFMMYSYKAPIVPPSPHLLHHQPSLLPRSLTHMPQLQLPRPQRGTSTHPLPPLMPINSHHPHHHISTHHQYRVVIHSKVSELEKKG